MLELIKLIKLHFKSLLVILSMGLHAQEKVIYILHTNNTNGALENCYCPDKPYGSVEKRSVFVIIFLDFVSPFGGFGVITWGILDLHVGLFVTLLSFLFDILDLFFHWLCMIYSTQITYST